MKYLEKMIISVLLIFLSNIFIHAQAGINSNVIASGGMSLNGTNYNMSCTVGQPIIGMSSGSINSVFSGFWYILSDNVTFIVPVKELIPEKFSLEQNFPNPFNPSTTIRISVTEPSTVTIKLYDILGAEVLTLFNGEMKAGVYNIQLNAEELASGIYIYRMSAIGEGRDFTDTRKMNLLK